MSGSGNLLRLYRQSKVRPFARWGVSGASTALRNGDWPRLGLSLAVIAYAARKKRNKPKLIYSTSLDTDQSFEIRVLRGRRPIAEARVDR